MLGNVCTCFFFSALSDAILGVAFAGLMSALGGVLGRLSCCTVLLVGAEGGNDVFVACRNVVMVWLSLGSLGSLGGRLLWLSLGSLISYFCVLAVIHYRPWDPSMRVALQSINWLLSYGALRYYTYVVQQMSRCHCCCIVGFCCPENIIVLPFNFDL